MAGYKYSYQKFNPEKMARAVGMYLPISRKDSIVLSTFLSGKKVDRAIKELDAVVEKSMPVPFKRFNQSIPHRKGPMASGRFPVKAAMHIKKIVESASANAKEKGLEQSTLRLCHISAQKGPILWHYGRHSRRRRKVAHIEIVVESVSEKGESKK